jgi:hypothetical protein
MRIALYDANVLYPSTLRDVLIRAGIAQLVVPRWTDQILDETFRNLKDFPSAALEPHAISAWHPDVFLQDLCRENLVALVRIVREIAAAWRRDADTAAVLKSLGVEAPDTADKISQALG